MDSSSDFSWLSLCSVSDLPRGSISHLKQVEWTVAQIGDMAGQGFGSLESGQECPQTSPSLLKLICLHALMAKKENPFITWRVQKIRNPQYHVTNLMQFILWKLWNTGLINIENLGAAKTQQLSKLIPLLVRLEMRMDKWEMAVSTQPPQDMPGQPHPLALQVLPAHPVSLYLLTWPHCHESPMLWICVLTCECWKTSLAMASRSEVSWILRT